MIYGHISKVTYTSLSGGGAGASYAKFVRATRYLVQTTGGELHRIIGLIVLDRCVSYILKTISECVCRMLLLLLVWQKENFVYIYFLRLIYFLNSCVAIEIGEYVDTDRWLSARCSSQASKAETRSAQAIANDRIETLVQVLWWYVRVYAERLCLGDKDLRAHYHLE